MNSHYEALQQQQETRNETAINFIQMAHFLIAVLANLTTYVAPVAPYRASIPFLGMLVVSLAARVGFWLYLRRRPPYLAARKYWVSLFDMIVFTVPPALLLAEHAMPTPFLQVYVICNHSLLIALSGLRYNVRLVLLTGATGFLAHSALFILPGTPDLRLPVLCVSGVTLGSITACTAYAVATLIGIHREAAVKDQLARFLPAELVDQMALRPELLQRRTERRPATVIFADVRGFTRMSEAMEPERVVEFLNEFLEEMTQAIMHHRGMLDKYIGDAVMGVFGVPFHAEDHAQRALLAALDMQHRLKRLNERLVQRGLPELSIGIGLHTGDLLVGAVGSSRRLDYTVIGDTVNVASRIEGLTRSYPVEILLSDSTRSLLDDAVPLYRVATVEVRNRREPLVIWSPDAPRSPHDNPAPGASTPFIAPLLSPQS